MLSAVTSPIDTAFLDGLRNAELVDGRTIVLDYRTVAGDYRKLPELANDLAGARPDVIASIVTQASIAAKAATSTIPIVMVAVSDPVTAGLVGNLARPGANVTGTAAQSHEAVGKQLELMRQIAPKVSRIVVLWNPTNTIFQQQSLGEALIAAARMRIVAQPIGVRSREDLEKTFATFASERPDALLLLPDPMFSNNRTRIAEMAIDHRVPAFSTFRTLTEAGILANYGPNFAVMAKRAVPYVQKILKGAKPADMPVELPTRLELVINAKTAAALDLTIPATVLSRADEVIR